MDSLIETVKQIIDTFTSGQILLVLSLIGGLIAAGVKFFTSDTGAKLLGRDPDFTKDMREQTKKIYELLEKTKTDIIKETDELKDSLKDIKSQLSSVIDSLKDSEEFIKDMSQNHFDQYDNLKEVILKSHMVIENIAEQLEKTEELIRRSEPDTKLSIKDLQHSIDEVKNELRRIDSFLINKVNSSSKLF